MCVSLCCDHEVPQLQTGRQILSTEAQTAVITTPSECFYATKQQNATKNKSIKIVCFTRGKQGP